MFPREIKNDATIRISSHQAIVFATEWSNEKVIAAIKERGIAGFVDPDGKTTWGMSYNDQRITAAPTVQLGAGCCSFSKNPTFFYLYPIHRNELAAVGLKEDDLIQYLKMLNDMKVGFNYLYFGEQEAPVEAQKWTQPVSNASTIPVDSRRYPNNTFYWIGSAPTQGKNLNSNEYNHNPPYIHWIYLRYLINQHPSGNDGDYNTSPEVLWCYYNIPRVMMKLVEEYGLTPFRAFLYTHAACTWYSGYGMTYSDHITEGVAKYTADLGISKATFKLLLNNKTYDGSMNNMLSAHNNSSKVCQENKIVLTAKHNQKMSVKLAREGNWVEFVDYLDKCYGLKKKSIPATKRKSLVDGTKIRKIVSKRKKLAASK